MRLRLDIGYDGTGFHGWATQPGLRTVQGEVEAALAVLLRGGPESEPPRLTVGGRTDAGVHARGQVAHLDVSEESAAKITPRRVNGVLLSRWNAWHGAERSGGGPVSRRVSSDAVVHAIRPVPDAFDARFGALRRRYEYRLRDAAARRDPLTARFTAEVSNTLDLDAMQRASDVLLGLQDFTTFCKAREGATAVRELLRFDWRRHEDGVLAASIEADAFCHSMVRALVGAIVAVGSSRIEHAELVRLRDARERTSRFVVMPAHGLSLEEIVYPDDGDLEVRAEQTRARREALDDA